jgi:hypothetical protein
MEQQFESLFATRKLDQYSLEEAVVMQYRMVDCIQKQFGGNGLSKGGDFGQVHIPGMKLGGTRPTATQKAERVIADIFGVEDCALVWGAGTGSIQLALMQAAKSCKKLLIHDAPIYKTTEQVLSALKFELVRADFDDWGEVVKALQTGVDAVYIQHIPQKPGEHFELDTFIQRIKRILPDLPVLVDDNYAVFRAKQIGIQMGADVSMFSFFKLLGPEGIGCILGNQKYISGIRNFISSAGCQIQGPLALEVLRSLIYAPAALAIQKNTVDQVVEQINRFIEQGKEPWRKWIHRAGGVCASHLNIVIQFKQPVAPQFLEAAWEKGAASYPVGEESKYDILPMFYRISSNFIKYDPQLEFFTIRINPFRSGPFTILNLLEGALIEFDPS